MPDRKPPVAERLKESSAAKRKPRSEPSPESAPPAELLEFLGTFSTPEAGFIDPLELERARQGSAAAAEPLPEVR